MALYVIGDTHFSSDRSKSMDVFGGKWLGYEEKLIESLGECLKEDDTLVLCGDFSWGMSLKDTLNDFVLLDRFPGRKLLLKGNHDYWWETVTKMKKFFDENNIKSIDFIHNNFFDYNGKILLCGTRGWMYDNSSSKSEEDKIFKREALRLRCSLQCAAESMESSDKEIVCFMHYPPVSRDYEVPAFCDVMREFNVKRCYYGHLHAESIRHAFSGEKSGIEYTIVSADALNFRPIKISD